MTSQCVLGSVPGMATPELTTAEKAAAIEEIAGWIAFSWDECPDQEATKKAVDRAFEALQIHSEPVLRNEVIAWFKARATTGTLPGEFEKHRHVHVWATIEHGLSGKSFGIRPNRRASEKTVDEALSAWRVGGKNVWPATVELLVESGFSRVEPDALRVDFARYESRKRDANKAP